VQSLIIQTGVVLSLKATDLSNKTKIKSELSFLVDKQDTQGSDFTIPDARVCS
jgi:hypothetical protein